MNSTTRPDRTNRIGRSRKSLKSSGINVMCLSPALAGRFVIGSTRCFLRAMALSWREEVGEVMWPSPPFFLPRSRLEPLRVLPGTLRIRSSYLARRMS